MSAARKLLRWVTGDEVPAITVDELARRVGSGDELRVIDVNLKGRFNKGHIPTARWMPFHRIRATDLPPDRRTTLVFYCHNSF